MIELIYREIEAGSISKEPFNMVIVKNPTDFMVDLACSGIGLELWADEVCLSYHTKINKDLVNKYIQLLGNVI